MDDLLKTCREKIRAVGRYMSFCEEHGFKEESRIASIKREAMYEIYDELERYVTKTKAKKEEQKDT